MNIKKMLVILITAQATIVGLSTLRLSPLSTHFDLFL
jgi:hypothetical protein